MKTNQKLVKQVTKWVSEVTENDPNAHVAVSMDQSGSMSDELIQSYLSVLGELAKSFSFVFIPFGYDVSEEGIFVWDKYHTYPDLERLQCGGSDLAPISNYVESRSFDLHILLTDMYAPEPPATRKHRLWIVPEGTVTPFATEDPVLKMEV